MSNSGAARGCVTFHLVSNMQMQPSRNLILSTIKRRNRFISSRPITYTSRLLSKDPWPLPHTPEHLSSTVTPTTSNPIPPLPRHNESEEKLRARLVYQSRKRGTLESDLLLSTFAKECLGGMTVEELKEYDKVSFCAFFLLLLSYDFCFINRSVVANANNYSCLTNKIGIFTTGRRITGHHRRGGPTRRCWKS